MQQSRYTPERFNPREGLSYGEWLDRRNRQATDRLAGGFAESYKAIAQTLTGMAGVAYDPEKCDEQVEEAMAILRQRNPLGGPWISLARDYQAARQAEISLVG